MQALIVAISLWLFSSFNTNEKQLTNTLTLEIENTIKIEEVLPLVYQPKEKPWITMENASTKDLKVQIDKYP